MDETINANNICRFCLTVSSQEMQVLTEDSEIFFKIRTSLQLQIKYMDKPFLQEVCKDCVDEIEKTYQFHQKITETQQLLTQYLNSGFDKLEKFYVTLKDKIVIKKEIKIVTENKENENKYDPTFDIKDQDDLNAHDNDINVDNVDSIANLEYKNYTDGNDLETDKNVDNTTVRIGNISGAVQILMKHKCLTCFKVFESQFLLLKHYNTEHNNKLKTRIVENNYKIVTLTDGNTKFNCNICQKDCHSKKSVMRHLALSHSSERPFLCKLCGRTYKTASEIIRHSRAHDGTRLFCSQQCGYSTVYPGALKEHERRHNKDEIKYKCEKCGKGFQVKTWYDQHQNIHSGLKPFVCDICGMAFHMDRYLRAHRSSVHPQSSDLKRYICVHCSLPCDSRNSLTQHLKEHGFNTKFLCDLCGKTLSNSGQLKAHKRMHLGVKPFSCSTCNKSFAKKSNLHLHERTHTGVKSHSCLQCGKNYSQRSTLLRHNMRHHALPEKQKSAK